MMGQEQAILPGMTLQRKHFFVLALPDEATYKTYERGSQQVLDWVNINSIDAIAITEGSWGPDYVCSVWYYAESSVK